MKVGQTVRWSSQAAGVTRVKKGEIVEVVPSGEWAKSKLREPGSFRDHESYVIRAVVINGSDSQRTQKRLYWPLVKNLELVGE